MTEPVIITAALVGAEVSKAQNPNLPVTVEEIIADAVRVWQAGAAMVHLHVRDEAGQPSQDRELFARVIAGIRQETDLIIQVSTGGAVGMSAAERLQPLDCQPDLATLSCGSVNFGDEIFANPWPLIREFARVMQEKGIKPELEIFDAGMLDTARRLLREGLLTPPLHVDFVLGVPGGLAGTVRNLVYLVESLPLGSTWSVAGVGRSQLPLAMAALAMGGHVRVGLEDNIYYRKGELADNRRLVERVVRLAGELERPVATPAEARKILGLT